jgi:hypothetical protein
VSFLTTSFSISGWIYDPDHSLPPGMYVDVPHLDCLLVAAPITVEGLDHVILKPIGAIPISPAIAALYRRWRISLSECSTQSD